VRKYKLREGCEGRRSRHCLVAIFEEINTMRIVLNDEK